MTLYIGVPISSDGNDMRVRCLLLCGSFDAPAKCLFQSFVQFNGGYGCPYCLHPGKTVKTSERGHTQTYPYNKENLRTGHFEERTHDQTQKFAKLAMESAIHTGIETPVKGVRGLSWFLHVPGFDIIRGTAIDYMHGTLLGVVKMLVKLWLDKQHHQAVVHWKVIKRVRQKVLKYQASKLHFTSSQKHCWELWPSESLRTEVIFTFLFSSLSVRHFTRQLLSALFTLG